jgi:hypothetical protein
MVSVDFQLTIKSGNEAFAQDAGAEVARILRSTADMIAAGVEGRMRLMDHNGNGVGRAVLEVWTEEA